MDHATFATLIGAACFMALLFFLTVVAVLGFRLLGGRGGRQLSARDAAALDHMGSNVERMEQRMAVLERILDTEVPAWRSNFADGDSYTRRAG